MGVGASGARYIFNETDNFTAHQKGSGPVVEQFVLSILLIRQGSSAVQDNFVVKVNTRVIFDPATGELVILREKVTTECRG